MSIYDDIASAAAVTIPQGAVKKITRKADGVLIWEKPASADPVLNNNDWATISEMSAAGQAANYWNIGDRKAVLVNGTVGTLTINQTLYVYIIGFDHNGATNTIDFGTFKTALSGGTDVCLVDGRYNSNPTNGNKYFNIQHWGSSNLGGWKGCDLRYDILGSTDIAPSGYGANAVSGRTGYDASVNCAIYPVAGTLMSSLPSELRVVMKPMTVYTENAGSVGHVLESVFASVDYLPLMAEFEIFGARTSANNYEQNYQKQYEYYKSGNSKVKYKYNSTTSSAFWWERSPNFYSTGFCYVYNSGAATNTYSNYSHGLAPIFRV